MFAPINVAPHAIKQQSAMPNSHSLDHAELSLNSANSFHDTWSEMCIREAHATNPHASEYVNDFDNDFEILAAHLKPMFAHVFKVKVLVVFILKQKISSATLGV